MPAIADAAINDAAAAIAATRAWEPEIFMETS